mmetsp:Transcript_30306/g.78437  ORF Transcript_30306/g.78437 Transcript_30306/m.78437 type:complete len:221 (-) Transcript_30306:290-952(-)
MGGTHKRVQPLPPPHMASTLSHKLVRVGHMMLKEATLDTMLPLPQTQLPPAMHLLLLLHRAMVESRQLPHPTLDKVTTVVVTRLSRPLPPAILPRQGTLRGRTLLPPPRTMPKDPIAHIAHSLRRQQLLLLLLTTAMTVQSTEVWVTSILLMVARQEIWLVLCTHFKILHSASAVLPPSHLHKRRSWKTRKRRQWTSSPSWCAARLVRAHPNSSFCSVRH